VPVITQRWPIPGCIKVIKIVLIPFLLLAADYVLSPIIWSEQITLYHANIADILSQPPLSLGTLKSHHIFITADDLSDQTFPSFLPTGSTTVVLSAFIEASPEHSGIYGALIHGVLDRLKQDSPDDYQRLSQELDGVKSFSPGQVLNYTLQLNRSAQMKIRLNNISIIAFNYGDQKLEEITKGLKNAITHERFSGVNNIIIPPLGVNWTNNSITHLSLTDFFNTLFEALPDDGRGINIYISLYRAWPTMELEDATRALNVVWTQNIDKMSDPLPLYRRSVRLTYIFLRLWTHNAAARA
jgi:hypothetical protein